jgi:hypothetical protein
MTQTVYTLIGRIHYEGDTLLGVFASLDDILSYVRSHQGQPDSWRAQTLGYDDLWYYVSQIGQQIDWDACIQVEVY